MCITLRLACNLLLILRTPRSTTRTNLSINITTASASSPPHPQSATEIAICLTDSGRYLDAERTCGVVAGVAVVPVGGFICVGQNIRGCGKVGLGKQSTSCRDPTVFLRHEQRWPVLEGVSFATPLPKLKFAATLLLGPTFFCGSQRTKRSKTETAPKLTVTKTATVPS